MNANWAIDTGDGRRLFVKQIHDVGAEQSLLQHAAVTALTDRGIPALPPLPTREGRTLIEHDSHLYAVFPWIEGVHVSGPQMSRSQAAHVGVLLGRIHRELAAVLPAVPDRMQIPVRTLAQACAGYARYAALIAQRQVPDEFDEFAAEQLAIRSQLLHRVQASMPDGSLALGPAGWTHADYHDRNLLFDRPEGCVIAVLDWDRVSPQPYGYEVARSGVIMFDRHDGNGLDLDRTRAFVTGYRSVNPIPSQAIAAGLARYWWSRVTSSWELGFHYDRDTTSCDQIFIAASALLTWWTQHREEVMAAFTEPRHGLWETP
jgi:homoserine kinase type II